MTKQELKEINQLVKSIEKESNKLDDLMAIQRSLKESDRISVVVCGRRKEELLKGPILDDEPKLHHYKDWAQKVYLDKEDINTLINTSLAKVNEKLREKVDKFQSL